MPGIDYDVHQGASVCNICGSTREIIWDVVCKLCNKTFCYEHGGVAQDNCIKSIENILGIYLGNWSTPQQKELKKED